MATAAIFNPYWDTLGGGEKYALSVATTLRDLGNQVSIYWPDHGLLNQFKSRYGIDATGISIDPQGYSAFQSGTLLDRYRVTHRHHVFFYVSDGSIPFLFSKKNLIHFQVPLRQLSRNPLTLTLKSQLIHSIICNSQFTAQVIKPQFNLPIHVVYPPVAQISPQDKAKVILSVGRFDNLLHSKRQDVLIQAFQKLSAPGWRLVLAGGVLHGEKKVQQLQTKVKNSAIDLVINPSWTKLTGLYAKASIYWHAAGFGSNLTSEPEKAEHFGISTVEAMSAGAVPVVFNGGGLREIITPQQNGYTWDQVTELISYTKKIIQSPTLYQKLSRNARLRSQDFSEEVFTHALQKAIS